MDQMNALSNSSLANPRQCPGPGTPGPYDCQSAAPAPSIRYADPLPHHHPPLVARAKSRLMHTSRSHGSLSRLPPAQTEEGISSMFSRQMVRCQVLLIIRVLSYKEVIQFSNFIEHYHTAETKQKHHVHVPWREANQAVVDCQTKGYQTS
ncbi:hypothetical protein BDZ91DRAFT_318306 [Kalaharituber pfeilii]|nr:hypothetical protein BDZ91DRAFT_318306 [Kalaharituber pfeilii]